MKVDKPGRSAGFVRSNEASSTPDIDPIRHNADEKSGSRTVIVVNPKQTQRASKPSRYADSLFLAHMFASKFDAPQQREKRRAEPGDANASYRKSERRPASTGRVLSKKV